MMERYNSGTSASTLLVCRSLEPTLIAMRAVGGSLGLELMRGFSENTAMS